MEYTVIDNFLELNDFKKISNLMLSEDFPWYFQSDITNKNENSKSYYLTHLFYNNYIIKSLFFETISPVIRKIQPLSLIRIKGNLYPNVNNFLIHDSHTDYPSSHKGAIFYINSNNGKTIIDDRYEIESVSNRILFFDPSTYHSSTNCTDDKFRVNINFNYF
jgi:hypothetical protein